MIPWEHLDRASVPGGGGEISLHRRGDELSIRIAGTELMNSRMHGSEEKLAELGCLPIREREAASVLVGGLGMGFTLAAALAQLGPSAQVVVAELIGAVVSWNRTHLGHLAGHPLKDARVQVYEGDVGQLLRERQGGFDAVLLDVDNGPSGLTRDSNSQLYGTSGLGAAHAALRAGGVLAVWSVASDPAFTRRLERAGFEVREHNVAARSSNKGPRHTLWIAVKA
jgi:spermidine synthase